MRRFAAIALLFAGAVLAADPPEEPPQEVELTRESGGAAVELGAADGAETSGDDALSLDQLSGADEEHTLPTANRAHPLERIPEDVRQRAREAHGWSLGQRVRHISEPWLGLPYEMGPLGEAGGVDPDPVTRYDVFDCLTFVEETLALALAPDPIDAPRVRAALRYRNGGPATYENRRHFMVAEWIPGTIAEGWMVDITPTFAGAVHAQKVVTPDVWANWRRRSLFALPDARLPIGSFDYWYLPLDAAAAAVPKIPPGSVVFTLREPWPHLPEAITHVGLTVAAEVPTMRHASRMGKRIVRDDKLAWYVEHLRTYVNWPAAGLIVLYPQEFGPTPGRLAAGE